MKNENDKRNKRILLRHQTKLYLHFFIFHTRKQPTQQQQQHAHNVRLENTKNKRNPTNRIIVQYILPINPIQYPESTRKKVSIDSPYFALRIETILFNRSSLRIPFSHHSLFHYTTTSIFISIKRCLGKLFKSFFPAGNPTRKKSSKIDLIKLLSFFFSP